MGIKDWREVIKMDLPDIGPVTYETVRRIQYNARMYGGGTRALTGRIWTDEDFEARRQRVLSTPLP
ncbi:MAG: hypothetical protein PHF67_03630 [Candidatus Nanoarchaeia archaeon]|nr:hypothetical protein [Candidatus Nanoarchaeia archaeon]